MWFTALLPSLKWGTGHRAKMFRKRPTRGFVPRLEILEVRIALSTLTVLNNLDHGAGSLRDAIRSAHSDDTIVFSPSLAGQTITLTSGALTIEKDLDIEGLGPSQVAISGNDSSRVFAIGNTARVVIAGLTITHGRVAVNGSSQRKDGGAGILNDGGTLSLRDDVLSYNQAIDSDKQSWVQGGAVLNVHRANLTATDSTFVGNIAVGGNAGLGGAIDSAKNSTATIVRCTFTDNQARGVDGGTLLPGGGDIGIAQGGAITNTEGSVMTVEDSTFTGNQAVGGNGGDSGAGASFSFIGISIGGAISNHDTSSLTLRHSTLTGNQAIGGSGITGGQNGHNFVGGAFGGGLFNEGSVEVYDSIFERNVALGGSGNTAGNPLDVLGVAWGGGIRTAGGIFGGTGTLIVSNSIFTGNRAIAGRGSAGGSPSEALGGAISVGTFYNPSVITNASVVASVLTGNQAVGGDGGAGSNGGDGLGGGIFIDAQSRLTVLGSTITANQATGGAAGTGGSAGHGIGGGAYFASGGIVCLDAFTLRKISRNKASTAADDVFGDFTICP